VREKRKSRLKKRHVVPVLVQEPGMKRGKEENRSSERHQIKSQINLRNKIKASRVKRGEESLAPHPEHRCLEGKDGISTGKHAEKKNHTNKK